MGSKMCHRCLPSLFLAVFVQLFCSCTSVGVQGVREVLVSADSLMNSSPEAALDTLNGIDSSSLLSLGRRDRAYYSLLRTEAEYKCYLPVGEDTVIFRAADYYRRKGPEELYARALIMQGAVQSERGESEAAMESYKAAEPVAERVGNLEQLGLLNVRIGELYQSSFVNYPESIEKIRKALQYFEAAGKEERSIACYYSLAGDYMAIDSSAAGYNYAKTGLENAELAGDTLNILHGLFLLSGYCFYAPSPDYVRCKEMVLRAVRMMNEAKNEYIFSTYGNDLYYFTAMSYAKTGQPDSALYYMQQISGEDSKAKIGRSSIKSILSYMKGDTLSSLESKMEADSIYYNTVIEGYGQQLVDLEISSENKLLKEQVKSAMHRQTIYRLVLAVIALSVMILTYFVCSIVKRMRKGLDRSTSIISILRKDSKRKEEELTYARMLSDELQKRLDSESSAKNEWMALHENLLKIENLIFDTYFRYGTTKAITAQLKTIIDTYFPEKQTDGQVFDILNLSYPGFISGVRREYGTLTEQNIYLIALIACGFSTGTICAFLRCSENTLNVTKTRIAKKMGLRQSLSSFIAEHIASYR